MVKNVHSSPVKVLMPVDESVEYLNSKRIQIIMEFEKQIYIDTFEIVKYALQKRGAF